MDFVTVAVVYLGGSAVLIALLLFGELPLFRGTPVAWCHWALTQGIWVALEWVAVKVGGPRVRRWIDATLEFCCDRPNHTMQVCYVLMIGIGYAMYCRHLFTLLPNEWAGEMHVLTGSLSVALCGVTFVWACVSDPGIVTEETLAAHTRLYPCDDLLWSEKTCVTCHWTRPARSKHCRVCNRCVARHDHHCGWINNCVGLLNHRIFLAFLAANLAMTVYGSVLGVVILLGEADRAGRLSYLGWDYNTGHVVKAYWPAAEILRFLMVAGPVPTALTLFMMAATVLVSLFLGYQLYLISRGTTQYEVYRWRVVQSAAELQDAAHTPSEDQVSSKPSADNDPAQKAQGRDTKQTSSKGAETGQALPSRARQRKRKVTSATGRPPKADAEPEGPHGGTRQPVCEPQRRAQEHPFNKGVLRNFSEVIFPYYYLRKRQSAQKK